jgi:hypothetical protein
MCPSTPANNVAIVSLEHSCPTGSRRCSMVMHIQDACGCVRRISTQLYRTPSLAGTHWLMPTVIPQVACAQHAEAIAQQLADQLRASPGVTPEAVSQSS